MALTPNIWRPEVVLSRSTLVLASANACYQPGETPKRLLANVHPSLRNELPDVCSLRLPLDESWSCGSGNHGRRRLSAARRLDSPIYL